MKQKSENNNKGRPIFPPYSHEEIKMPKFWLLFQCINQIVSLLATDCSIDNALAKPDYRSGYFPSKHILSFPPKGDQIIFPHKGHQFTFIQNASLYVWSLTMVIFLQY